MGRSIAAEFRALPAERLLVAEQMVAAEWHSAEKSAAGQTERCGLRAVASACRVSTTAAGIAVAG